MSAEMEPSPATAGRQQRVQTWRKAPKSLKTEVGTRALLGTSLETKERWSPVLIPPTVMGMNTSYCDPAKVINFYPCVGTALIFEKDGSMFFSLLMAN